MIMHTFGLYRRRTDAATFAVWLWANRPQRAMGPLGTVDLDSPPTAYDFDAAAPAQDLDLAADFEPCGDPWHLECRRGYPHVAAGAAFADRVQGDAALRDAVDGTHGRLKSWADAVNRV